MLRACRWLEQSLTRVELGAALLATFPIYGACAGDYFSRHVIGTVIGAWTPFYGLGAIASHWLGGMLRDATGRYDEAFALNALMAFAAFLLFFAVGRPRPQG